jgi:hypothetical protein
MSPADTAPPDQIRELVPQRYAEIARDGSVNSTASCCGPRPAEIAERIGYSAEDTSAVPELRSLCPVRWISAGASRLLP